MTGTIYGAGLKTQKEWEEVCSVLFCSIIYFHQRLLPTHTPPDDQKLTTSSQKQEKQKVREATAEDKIEILANRRAQLFKTKIEIEQKLADVRERMRLEKEKEEKEKSGKVAMPRR